MILKTVKFQKQKTNVQVTKHRVQLTQKPPELHIQTHQNSQLLHDSYADNTRVTSRNIIQQRERNE
ncbi:hypothetical protein Hanom_Chr12g01067531 [Helianthus anomalus]